MEILYCNDYETLVPMISARHHKLTVKGLTEERIAEIEQTLNNGMVFPAALREFLFLGGASNNIGLDCPLYGQWERFNLGTKKIIDNLGLLPLRPVFLYERWEEVVSFIYLDEGDDPQPWNLALDEDYYYDVIERDASGNIISEKELKVWKQPYKTFSEMINTTASRIARGLTAV
jgi:hypothetical protein